MPKKSSSGRTSGPDWFLPEWMASLRVTQADLCRATGWSKATANDIYHGKTEYYRAIVNQLADALHVQPWELLMSPEDAHHIRRLRAAAADEYALRVAESGQTYKPGNEPAERIRPRKAS